MIRHTKDEVESELLFAGLKLPPPQEDDDAWLVGMLSQAEKHIDCPISAIRQCIIEPEREAVGEESESAVGEGSESGGPKEPEPEGPEEPEPQGPEPEAVDEYPELTEQQSETILWAMRGGARTEMIITKFGITMLRCDLSTLDERRTDLEKWLNDQVMNFYMRLNKLRSDEVESMPKVYAMSTHFMGNLLARDHDGVKRWTRKVDIFSVDIILVTSFVGGNH